MPFENGLTYYLWQSGSPFNQPYTRGTDVKFCKRC